MPRAPLLRHQPNLQKIGKSQRVELDEPPDEDDFSFHHPSFYYEYSHATGSAAILDKIFDVVQPTGHVIKRHNGPGSGFLHSKHGSSFAMRYKQLRSLLQTRAKLQLTRDYMTRLNAAAMFVKDLENVVQEEYGIWWHISHDTLNQTPVTHLNYLSDICEDLRIHMNHWNSIKQLMHTDQWLKPLLSTLSKEMEMVRHTLKHMLDIAVWWIDRLIRVGLQVLAHTDLERLSKDSMWSITRGIENFNNILIAMKYESSIDTLFSRPALSSEIKTCRLLKPGNVQIMNSFQNIGESIRPIPFIRVLNILANERAKYVAVMIHRTLTTHDVLMDTLVNHKLPEFSWTDQEPVAVGKECLNNTSDYHSASQTSLATITRKIGHLHLPDLNKDVIAIMEFAEREQEFASKFLEIVCHSTELLKQSQSIYRSSKNSRGGSISSRHGSIRRLPSQSSKPPPATAQSRKSVSWGDAADDSVTQQLSSKYLDLFWQYSGSHLYDFFHHPIWGGPEAVKDQLGQIVLCEDIIIMVIVRMLLQMSKNDSLSNGACSALQTISSRLVANTAWINWYRKISLAMASHSIDKCYATPLAGGDYSTQTARLLRDAFAPLIYVLWFLELQANHASTKAAVNGVVTIHSPQMSLVQPTLQRLIMTCDRGILWSTDRTMHHLTSWSLGSFLLVSQSDLKILGDEIKRSAAASQKWTHPSMNHNSSASEIQSQIQLSTQWNRLNDINAQIQSLAGTVVRLFAEKSKSQALEFFEDSMPVGKVWKKKYVPDELLKQNQYSEFAMSLLIEPVVAGVNKLRVTAQLSAVSIAVKAVAEAWMEFILKHKIRFSLQGALQLAKDFSYMSTWLEENISQDEVRQSVLALDVLKHLKGAGELLQRQQQGRSRSRPPPNQRAYLSDDSSYNERPSSSSSYGSANATEMTTQGPSSVSAHHQSAEDNSASARGFASRASPSSSYMSIQSLSQLAVPHMEQWLALRVNGGARSWPKLPSCFNMSNECN